MGIKAKIKGKIVSVDLAGRSKNEYKEFKNLKLKYLGRGYYYSIDGKRQESRKFAHFFERK